MRPMRGCRSELATGSRGDCFLVDAQTGQPLDTLGLLHESILSMDPSGREMRPD